MRINLCPHGTLGCHAKNLNFACKVLRCAVLTLALYFTLWGILSALSPQVQTQGVFSGAPTFQPWAKKKAHGLLPHFSNRDLALNFLANQRALSMTLASDFQTSGLTHLLAISGGQVSPLAKMGSWLVTAFFTAFTAPFFSQTRILILNGFVRSTAAGGIAFGIAALFGNTGALLRVGFLHFGSQNPFLRKVVAVVGVLFPFISFQSFLRLFLIAFFLLFFGNPFINPSFLLSALGATLASHSFSVWKSILRRSSKPKKAFQKIQYKIFNHLIPQILATVATALVLFPFLKVSFLNSVCANIISLPLVNLAVTPLSLLALFLPESHPLQALVLPLLNLSFEALAFCAKAFASGVNANPFAAGKALFTPEAKMFFSGVLFSCWTLSDVLIQMQFFNLTRHQNKKQF